MWIGVDLDCCLAHYDVWRGHDHIGKPITAMVERVKAWLSGGKRVKIFTARVAEGTPEAYQAIQQWCIRYLGEELEITATKDRHMLEMWDDRAIQVLPNIGEPVAEHYVRTSKGFTIESIMGLYMACVKLLEEHTETRIRRA